VMNLFYSHLQVMYIYLYSYVQTFPSGLHLWHTNHEKKYHCTVSYKWSGTNACNNEDLVVTSVIMSTWNCKLLGWKLLQYSI
jgi:hypothetical protein